MDWIEFLKGVLEKVEFKGVKEIGEFRVGSKTCRNFIGRFEAPAPAGTDPEALMDGIQGKPAEAACRRIRRTADVDGQKFHYVFDLSPMTICRAEVKESRLSLYAVGYGVFGKRP